MTYEVAANVRIARSGKMTTLSCLKCNADTPHRHLKCIYCGELHCNPSVEANRQRKIKRINKSFRLRIIEAARKNAQVQSDRREAFRRAAEESRRKWEAK